jgi:hypothetical protein
MPMLNYDDIREIIENASNQLENEENIAGEMASTNVDGCFEFQFEIKKVYSAVPVRSFPVRVLFSYTFSGQNHEDKPFSGDKVEGEAFAIIDSDKNVTFDGVKATRNI